MSEASETITNSGQEPLAVWIEPWADRLVVPPGEAIVIAGSSQLDGRFEVDRTGAGIVVYGWAGCTAVVRSGDTVIRTFDIPVPGIPSGMSMKDFVGVMFGEPAGGVATREAASRPKKPWWRPW